MGRGALVLPGIFLFLAAALSAAPRSAMPVVPVLKADLTLDRAPLLVFPPGHTGAISESWTVRNIGTAATPPTQVEFRCTRIFADGAVSTCGATPQLIDVPPLDIGGTFKAVSSNAASIEGKPGQRYRFNLTAKVDPKGLVAESNKQNNSASFVAENFAGDPSSPSAAPAAAAMAAAVVQLATNPAPWNPNTPAWVELKNSGPLDAPALTVQVSCVQKTAGELWQSAGDKESMPALHNVPCFYLTSPTDIPPPASPDSLMVPAVAKGHFKAFYEIKYFRTGDTSFDKKRFLGGAIRFHVVGAASNDLVLSTIK